MEIEVIKQVIVVRKDLNMRKGKIAAQVAHASCASILDSMTKIGKFRILSLFSKRPISKWLNGSFTKIVVGVEDRDELIAVMRRAHLYDIQLSRCIDSGKTEFNSVPTLTCVAVGPDIAKKVDKVTGHLTLL